MLHQLNVDWEKHGYDEAALDELAEIGLRTLHSLLDRSWAACRETASSCADSSRRWIGPAIVYPKLAQAMDAPLEPSPARRRRRSAQPEFFSAYADSSVN